MLLEAGILETMMVVECMNAEMVARDILEIKHGHVGNTVWFGGPMILMSMISSLKETLPTMAPHILGLKCAQLYQAGGNYLHLSRRKLFTIFTPLQ